MVLVDQYRRVDRQLKEWRRSRPLLWATVYGGVVAICFALVVLAFGATPVEAVLRAGLFAVVFTGLTAWTTGSPSR